MDSNSTTRIMLFTQQPFVGHGLEAVMKSRPEFDLVASLDDLAGMVARLKSNPPDVVLAYLTSGISLSELRELRGASLRTPVLLWGQGMAGEFVFQAMQLGVRGMLPSETSVEGMLAALRRVQEGGLCFEEEIMETVLLQKRVVLSPRESQIVALVAQGLKNKEIACSLELSEGTVKVYLSRIFRKLDMNDRLDLALYGLKNLFCGQVGLNRTSESRHPGADRELACPRSLPLRTREMANARIPN